MFVLVIDGTFTKIYERGLISNVKKKNEIKTQFEQLVHVNIID